jgi:hypothetical protein
MMEEEKKTLQEKVKEQLKETLDAAVTAKV